MVYSIITFGGITQKGLIRRNIAIVEGDVFAIVCKQQISDIALAWNLHRETNVIDPIQITNHSNIGIIQSISFNVKFRFFPMANTSCSISLHGIIYGQTTIQYCTIALCTDRYIEHTPINFGCFCKYGTNSHRMGLVISSKYFKSPT